MEWIIISIPFGSALHGTLDYPRYSDLENFSASLCVFFTLSPSCKKEIFIKFLPFFCLKKKQTDVVMPASQSRLGVRFNLQNPNEAHTSDKVYLLYRYLYDSITRCGIASECITESSFCCTSN